MHRLYKNSASTLFTLEFNFFVESQLYWYVAFCVAYPEAVHEFT